MKRVLVIIVCLVAILFLGSYPNEPVGFRGTPWGSPMKTFGNMPDYETCSYVSNKYNIQTIGCRLSSSKETLMFMGERPQTITYMFHDGKQWAVGVHYDKADEKALLKTFKEFYGPGITRGGNTYWIGNRTIINYEYPDISFVSAQVVKEHDL